MPIRKHMEGYKDSHIKELSAEYAQVLERKTELPGVPEMQGRVEDYLVAERIVRELLKEEAVYDENRRGKIGIRRRTGKSRKKP